MAALTRNASCRICGDNHLTQVWTLGPQPLANAFLRPEELDLEEARFPLDVYFCRGCRLLQLVDVVVPEVMFRDYVYASSTSPVFVEHFRQLAQDVQERLHLRRDSLVVDIGSNDGILLRPFRDQGARVVGVEPAANIAVLAREAGIETVTEFFTPRVASGIAASAGRAALVTATNVFAHVNDLDSFLLALDALLDADGVFIIEVPYLGDLIAKRLWDTVYHEHLSYFALGPLVSLFGRHGLAIFDIQHVDTHGGSLRVFVQRASATRPIADAIPRLLSTERDRGLDRLDTYQEFAALIQQNKQDLVGLLRELKDSGQRIAAYGAPAKGNTLLNYCGIDRTLLDYVVDDSPLKQGLHTPGTHIPVVSAAKLRESPPHCLLILAWNFADAIMAKLSSFREQGGRFVVPVPKPVVA
jgi:SAM-dependent methyltransferase